MVCTKYFARKHKTINMRGTEGEIYSSKLKKNANTWEVETAK